MLIADIMSTVWVVRTDVSVTFINVSGKPVWQAGYYVFQFQSDLSLISRPSRPIAEVSAPVHRHQVCPL